MTFQQRRQRLRALLAGGKLVQPASVYDPLSARAAEQLGFELMMMAGSTASLAVLGAPDLVLLSLTEFAEQARRVTRASTLPLLVDADHGYGNALGVMRCVQELEAAGVAALSIEDTALPRPFGMRGETFLSLEEGAGKMRAAVAARVDPSLMILARTGAIRVEGLAGVLRRAAAYAETGVDGLFLVGLRTRAELEAVRTLSSLPLVLGGATAELSDRAYLASQGVRIGLWNHRPLQAATVAMYEALRAARDEAGPDAPPLALAGEAVLDTLSRKDGYDEQAALYLHDAAGSG
jgi:oxaloacetate decarboxylase